MLLALAASFKRFPSSVAQAARLESGARLGAPFMSGGRAGFQVGRKSRRFLPSLLNGSADDRPVGVLRLDLAVVSHPPDPGGIRAGAAAQDRVAVHRKQSARQVARLGRFALGMLCLFVQLGAGPGSAAAQPAPRARIVLSYDPSSEQ